MADEEAAQADEEPDASASAEEADDATASAEDSQDTAADEAGSDDTGVADAVDSRAAELTGGGGDGGGGGDDQPISEINRDAVEAATEHLDDANLDADRATLKEIQKEM